MKAQEHNPPLTLIERAQPAGEKHPVIAARERLGAVRRLELLLVVGDRDRFAGTLGLKDSLDLVFIDSEGDCELSDTGRVTERRSELPTGVVQLGPHPLQLSRDPQRAGAVAEMATDLTFYCRRDEGRERDAAIGVEALTCLHKPDRAGLHEIVELLATACVAARNGADERQVSLDQRLSRGFGNCRSV
jgi:hypothetical protein